MYCAVTTMSPRFTICPYVLAYDFKRQVLSISDVRRRDKPSLVLSVH
jgi:hypothetical protein